jgi:hypothetical protein
MSEIVLSQATENFALSKEYSGMIDHIKSTLPAVANDTENFYKSSSQYKGITLDVTDLTTIGSLKHILAVIDQTKGALEEAHIDVRKKQIELKKKQLEFDNAEDGYEKDLLEVDILQLNNHIRNIENSASGAIRKLSFFITQYKALMEKLGVDEITEEEYERNESRHHIMTAMKQALNAARTRGGVIDEGNHIYLFEMGINGAVAQAEILGYLHMEEEMLSNGQAPTHEMTIKWLEACADKFEDCGRKFAEYRGLIPLDKKSLAKELTDEASNSI